MKSITEIAESWIDTPYRYGAKTKGKGVDCARLIVSVFQEAGLLPMGYEPPYQHRDWHYGKKIDKNVFVDEILRFTEKVCEDDIQEGDIVSFYYNGIESHLAIAVKGECIVHAVSGKRVKKQRIKKYLNICSIYRIKK